MILEEIILNDKKISRDTDCIPFKMFVSEPEIEYSEITIDGREEVVVLGEQLKERSVEFSFAVPYEAKSEFTTFLLKNKQLKIQTNRFNNRYINCKIQKVDVEEIGNRMIKFEVNGVSVSPYFFSSKLKALEFTDKTFSFLNVSDVAILATNDYLSVEISAKGTSLQILNETTNDLFEYVDENGFDVYNKILMNGVVATRDGSNIFSKTNRKFIGLSSGINEISINVSELERVVITFREKFLSGGDVFD